MLHLVCISLCLPEPDINYWIRVLPSIYGSPELYIPHLRA